MQLVYNDEEHVYYVDGILVPCVSDIIGIIRPPFNEHNLGGRTLQDHADEGTYMHNVAESLMKNEDFDISNCAWEDMAMRVVALNSFKQKITEVIATEQVVYHERLNYIGRIDLVAEIDGEICIVDYKKGKPDKYSAMSTLLYLKAYNEGWLLNEENDGSYWKSARKATKRLVIQPKKDGSIGYLNQKYMDMTTDESLESLINLYNWKSKGIR